MRYLNDVHSVFNIDIIDSLMQQAYEIDGEDKLEIVLSKHLDLGNEKIELAWSDHVEEAIESLYLLPPKNARFDVSFIDLPLSSEKLLPSILQVPTLELKPLSYHLKIGRASCRERVSYSV